MTTTIVVKTSKSFFTKKELLIDSLIVLPLAFGINYLLDFNPIWVLMAAYFMLSCRR